MSKVSFSDFNGFDVCVGDMYYPVHKKTFEIYEPFMAHEKTSEQLGGDCFYFGSLTSAKDFISLKKNIDKEFSRYKQDCRKRALEMAHSENKVNAIEMADKYYEWLINIPQ